MGRNIFDVRGILAGDDTTPRCVSESTSYRCRNEIQFPDGLCGYHHARRVHDEHAAHATQTDEVCVDGCWFCSDSPGELPRLLGQRLEEVAAIEDGWYDGDGLATTPVAAAKARELLAARPKSVVYVSLCPNSEGGISVEDMYGDPAAQFLLADVDADGRFMLFAPLTPEDEHSPANDDGMVFTSASEFWAYVQERWDQGYVTQDWMTVNADAKAASAEPAASGGRSGT